MNSKSLHMVAFALLLVGGLNWGLWGLFNINLVEWLLGMWPMLVKLVYILVGLSAVYIAVTHMQSCTYCMDKPASKKKR